MKKKMRVISALFLAVMVLLDAIFCSGGLKKAEIVSGAEKSNASKVTGKKTLAMPLS